MSVTTRSPRPGERAGREYRFVSRAAFDRLRRTRQLLEWANVHGEWYGTPKAPVLSTLHAGRSVVLNIDVQGARNVRRLLKRKAVLIFLKPPSVAQLRRRLQRRSTDSPDAIRRRLAVARRELACAAWYDHVVVNRQMDTAVARVRRIIQRMLQRREVRAWPRSRSKS